MLVEVGRTLPPPRGCREVPPLKGGILLQRLFEIGYRQTDWEKTWASREQAAHEFVDGMIDHLVRTGVSYDPDIAQQLAEIEPITGLTNGIVLMRGIEDFKQGRITFQTSNRVLGGKRERSPMIMGGGLLHYTSQIGIPRLGLRAVDVQTIGVIVNTNHHLIQQIARGKNPDPTVDQACEVINSFRNCHLELLRNQNPNLLSQPEIDQAFDWVLFGERC